MKDISASQLTRLLEEVFEGEIIFEGTPRELLRAKTLTGEYLAGKRKTDIQSAKNPNYKSTVSQGCGNAQ